MKYIINHSYIFLTVIFAVASQMIIKWQASKCVPDNMEGFFEKFFFAITMLLNPYIIISIMLTFLSGLFWIIAMTKFEISYAYPYTALGYVFVLLFSVLFFNESLNFSRCVGVLLIISGIFVVSRSM